VYIHNEYTHTQLHNSDSSWSWSLPGAHWVSLTSYLTLDTWVHKKYYYGCCTSLALKLWELSSNLMC